MSDRECVHGCDDRGMIHNRMLREPMRCPIHFEDEGLRSASPGGDGELVGSVDKGRGEGQRRRERMIGFACWLIGVVGSWAGFLLMGAIK